MTDILAQRLREKIVDFLAQCLLDLLGLCSCHQASMSLEWIVGPWARWVSLISIKSQARISSLLVKKIKKIDILYKLRFDLVRFYEKTQMQTELSDFPKKCHSKKFSFDRFSIILNQFLVFFIGLDMTTPTYSSRPKTNDFNHRVSTKACTVFWPIYMDWNSLGLVTNNPYPKWIPSKNNLQLRGFVF